MPTGFTLIELLVVVTILAVIAGMLMAAVGMVRSAAESARCAGNVRQLLVGMVAYRNDWDGFMPPLADSVVYTNWGLDPTEHRWQQRLDRYLEDFRIFNCPVSARLVPSFAIRDRALDGQPRGCAGNGLGVCLYAYSQESWGSFPDAVIEQGPLQEAQVSAQLRRAGLTVDAARCPVLMDGVWAFDGYPATPYWPNLAGNGWGCFFPHRGIRQNTGFNDGHVETHVLRDVAFSGSLVAIP